MTKITRSDLRKLYAATFDDFAINAEDGAELLGITKKEAAAAFGLMSNLTTGEQVNGVGPIVYQCYETYDSISRSTALRRFDKAFPKNGHQAWSLATPEKTGRKGATGPRYSESQIALGVKLTAKGETAKAVATEVGVKSPSYFRKLCKAAIVAAEAEKAAKPKRVRRAKAAKSADVQVAA